jgi:high-affinity iron transporter
MLATLVIGLREGLEASLIVGILGAFLKRTGKPVRPMWIGVGIAVLLSIAVAVTLQLVSASLPQAAQEGMESIIGLAAVAIVTGMIGWMNTHARNMRRELEQHAAAATAVKDGTAWALIAMAFLAVLKEGFETAVFLLAAFQASTSVAAASAGAIIGVLIAVGIGYGIFQGGVKLNLGRFFRVTGIFLVFVAAGLVLTSIRTAHEAGWIAIGQQQVLNLSWLAPNGSIQAALFTGVLGIPADPRLIEVVGWLAYLLPAIAYLLWPLRLRPKDRALARFRVGLAASLVVAAVTLAVAVTLPSYQPATTVSIRGANGFFGTVSLTTNGTAAKTAQHNGIETGYVSSHLSSTNAATEPSTLTLTQLVALNGDRLPIGMDWADDPGPFTVHWTTDSTTKIWTANGGLVDASSTSTTIATLTGGGLASSRTLTPASAQSGNWRMTASERNAALNGILNARAASAELLLWKFWIPIAMLLAALTLSGYAIRRSYTPTPEEIHA